MEFSPHPSSSNTQSRGKISSPLSPFFSFMACWPWHLTFAPSDMPCCQEFSSSEVCSTTNRILYNLDGLHSRGQGSERKRQTEVLHWEVGKIAKAKLASCQGSPLQFLSNVGRDGILYLLGCLQIANACADYWCSDRWEERASKNAKERTEKHCMIQKTNGVLTWPWQWVFKITLFILWQVTIEGR